MAILCETLCPWGSLFPLSGALTAAREAEFKFCAIFNLQESLFSTFVMFTLIRVSTCPMFLILHPSKGALIIAFYFACILTEFTPPAATGDKRDVVFLIDGSSATRSEFPSVRDMIRRVVEQLDVGLDRVRVSVVQYSDDPKPEFLLNEHSTKAEVRQAVMKLRSSGGNRLNTGRALEWVSRNIYQRSAGSRIEEGVPQFLILVTGGRSSDDVSTQANQLKRNQVAPLAIGSRNADLNENVIFYFTVSGNLLEFMFCHIFVYFAATLDLGKKDIIFLIDGSDTTGPNGIAHIRDFIVSIVQQLDVQDNLRIGLAQYATDVSDAFFLNTYSNRDNVIEAIGKIEYKGGRRIMTGDAIRHVQDVHFSKQRGSRKDEGTPQILMLVTGGRSQDDGKTAALGLKNKGVRIFAVGVIIHLTDGLDAPYAEMKRRVEELHRSGTEISQEKESDYRPAVFFNRMFLYNLNQESTVSFWLGWSGWSSLKRLCCWNLAAALGTQGP
uniref:VWFA domain-containing protein n=1 Tax=Xiphophorus couchianus TaxID=32473 RepID=A0A3B5M7Q2_9TELE